MAIKQRFTRPARLRYHRLFGSITEPPFGLVNGERVYGVPEYQRDLDDMRTANPRLTDGQAKTRVLRSVILDNVIGDPHLRMVGFPLEQMDGAVVPTTSDPIYGYEPRFDSVIVGWTYDRFEGLGRGDGFGCWAATRPGYLAYGTPAEHRTWDNGVERISFMAQHPPKIMGMNLFEDFAYLGEVQSVANETHAVHRALEAKRVIVRDYEKRFDVRIKWYGRR